LDQGNNIQQARPTSRTAFDSLQAADQRAHDAAKH
jgi:hypothetical protein